MGIVIGMDEAGYGPNLGPLVITATVWEVPGNPHECDFWSAFSDVVDQEKPSEGKLHIADSKVVYSSGKGLQALETSVHCLLALLDHHPRQLNALWRLLIGGEITDTDCGPWLHGRVLDLPIAVKCRNVFGTCRSLAGVLSRTGHDLVKSSPIL